jgi:succinyldiaminopimelate transaminase
MTESFTPDPAAPRWSSPATRLPDFPWDLLAEAKATASAHDHGVVDLSIGTPVDPVPTSVRSALSAAADAPGYPTVHGTLSLRRAYSEWLERAHGVPDLDPQHVLPTIGSKELVASLPAQLGLGPGSLVVIPELAYPTYQVGVLAAGATAVRADALTALGPDTPAMIWLNSPSNPTGRVLGVPHLAKVVEWARRRGVVVVSDECYLDLGWETQPVSVLHPDICHGDHTGLLAVHSLSKRSNMAGYRAGFVSGDPAIIASLIALRKHLGLIVPTPVQAAAAAALSDDGHVVIQRMRYGKRREVLTEAFEEAGFRLADGHSAAGLYLWLSRGEPAMTSVAWLAERGILVAPGTFYGPAGARHIRVALTATDERVARAVDRLGE